MKRQLVVACLFLAASIQAPPALAAPSAAPPIETDGLSESPAEPSSDALLEEARRIAEDAKATADNAVESARAAQRAADRARADARAMTARSAAEQKAAEERAAQAEALAKAEEEQAKAAQEEAQEAEKKMQAAQLASQEARQRSIWIAAGSAGAVVLALLLAWLLIRRSKKSQVKPVPSVTLRSSKVNLSLDGAQLPEQAGGVTIGRNPEKAQAVINSNAVGRIHARAYHSEGRYWLVDLGSKNGTILNGEPLVPEQPQVIENGDEIEIAESFGFTVQVASA